MEKDQKSTGVYVVVIILCLLVLGLGGFIVYDKVLSKNDNSNKSSTEKTETKTNSLVSKLDKDKDWVYAAEYEKKVTVDYYDLNHERYYLSDVVVPYFNIDSSFAKEANEETKKVFDKAIEIYNEGTKGASKFVKTNYQKNIYKDSLSVVLTYSKGGTDVVHPEYYTYNIDLNTGKKLSYEEVYKLAGFSSDNIETKVKSAITTYFKKYYSDFTDDYATKTIEKYQDSVKNSTIKYFLSGSGKLSIIVTFIIPAGTGEFATIVTID